MDDLLQVDDDECPHVGEPMVYPGGGLGCPRCGQSWPYQTAKKIADGPYGGTPGTVRNYTLGEEVDQRLLDWMTDIRTLAYKLIEQAK